MVAERTTEPLGGKDAEVITARLVQDERGWLRLVGYEKQEIAGPVSTLFWRGAGHW
jgi:hypothetical protein